MRKSSLLAVLLTVGNVASAQAACSDSAPFVSDATIRFEAGSSSLQSGDVQAIHEIAARAAMRRADQVCVYGSASKQEQGGETLALDRAESVADELRAAGVPMSQIETIPVTGDDLFAAFSEVGKVQIVLEP